MSLSILLPMDYGYPGIVVSSDKDGFTIDSLPVDEVVIIDGEYCPKSIGKSWRLKKWVKNDRSSK